MYVGSYIIKVVYKCWIVAIEVYAIAFCGLIIGANEQANVW